jgi:hypothetical protein
MGKNWSHFFTIKVKNEMKVFTLYTLIKYSAWILIQSNKARVENKSDTNRKERSQIIPSCRLYDPILKVT